MNAPIACLSIFAVTCLPAPAQDSVVIAGSAEGFWITSMDAAPIAKGSFRMQFEGNRAHVFVELPGVGAFQHGRDDDRTWEIDAVAGPSIRTGFAAESAHRLFALLRGDVDAAAASYPKGALRDGPHASFPLEGQDASDIWLYAKRASIS